MFVVYIFNIIYWLNHDIYLELEISVFFMSLVSSLIQHKLKEVSKPSLFSLHSPNWIIISLPTCTCMLGLATCNYEFDSWTVNTFLRIFMCKVHVVGRLKDGIRTNNMSCHCHTS